MFNYKLVIEYDGLKFNGWQRQKNSHNTVQEKLEDAISTVLKKSINIIGAGRTDAGVSALGQVANFKTEINIEGKNFLHSINSILPPEITVKNIKKVPLSFHSRYSAKKREYIYQITTAKKSISRNYFCRLIYDVNFSIVDEFIKHILGYKNFKSLCKAETDKHNFFCNLYVLNYKVFKSRNEIYFKIVADRFLRSMVRGVIGCLIDLGRGHLDLTTTKEQFNRGERIKTTYLPANALFLKKIYY
ncbi:MAG: tRNA pseudouridine(38-40) synthase TruA [Ignavibacteria bacterium]